MKNLKLHLGCGKRMIPGFVHVDEADFPHIDHKHDVRSLPFVKNETVELIYASHVLEYFDRTEAERVLSEWFRTLAKGGVLRLAVPDFEALKKVYEKHQKLEMILGPLYGKMEIKTPKGTTSIYHKTVYDFVSLKNLLESRGFCDVQKYDWKKTLHKDYDDHSQAYIPHMEKDKGLLISLNVEARKK